jgi:hypothetical protein
MKEQNEPALHVKIKRKGEKAKPACNTPAKFVLYGTDENPPNCGNCKRVVSK